MNQPGGDFLSGAIFAEQQDGQVGIGHSADRRSQRLDGRTVTDHLHSIGRFVDQAPVGEHQLFQLVSRLQRRGRVGCQFDQPFLIFIGKLALLLVQHFESTEPCATGADQGYAEDVFGGVTQLLVDLAVNLLFGLLAIDPLGFAGLHHVSDNALVVGDP